MGNTGGTASSTNRFLTDEVESHESLHRLSRVLAFDPTCPQRRLDLLRSLIGVLPVERFWDDIVKGHVHICGAVIVSRYPKTKNAPYLFLHLSR